MKIPLRSYQTTMGRRMAGARALWRANGMKDEHFGKPIIGIANSFTQLVPGHVHLHSIGQFVKSVIEKQGCFAAEFNTIAIDDGIAMGHSGMLYSLPSRELIADSVEYQCNAHCLDALICIPNCDKVVPGMLMAAMRLNIPCIFVSGGPMEAGNWSEKAVDLVDAMVLSADPSVSDAEIDALERSVCPTCGSCSGMFTANSMNCLTEALGLAFPCNGTLIATHTLRKKLFEKAGTTIVELALRWYEQADESVLPRSIVTRPTILNAMATDIAMGGSTNTVLHLLAIAKEAEVTFTMKDIDRLSRKVPCLCKISPSSRYHIQDVNRAGGILSIMSELARAGLIDTSVKRIDYPSLKDALIQWDIVSDTLSDEASTFFSAAPAGSHEIIRTIASQHTYYDSLDTDRDNGCIRQKDSCYHKEGGLAVLYGNIAEHGCIVKTAGVDQSLYTFSGKALVFHSQEDACDAILNGLIQPGTVVVIVFEGPKGGPGMQEMLYPTSYLKSQHLDRVCALITDGRFSGGTSGLSIGHISPEGASQGTIALLKDGDIIDIDIPSRTISVRVSQEELSIRRHTEITKGADAFKPHRNRRISTALSAYAHFVSSADTGALRIIP